MSATFTVSIGKSEEWRRVKCVLETGTNTEAFLSDQAGQWADGSLSPSSEESPTFFKSSSSHRETVYEAILHPLSKSHPSYTDTVIQKQIDVISPINSSKSSDYNSINSDIIPSAKIVEPEKNKTNVTTASDTFEFLFAPVQDKNINNDVQDFETENVNTKRVNFDFLKSEILKDYNFEGSSVFKSLINRNMTSFVYENENLSSGDQNEDSKYYKKGTSLLRRNKYHEWKMHENNEDNLLSKYMKSVCELSDNQFSKQDSYLPSNPEGDTYDSHSDMIKIYPQIEESKHTRQQLYNYLHHEETPVSQYSTLSDSTKLKSLKPVTKVKVQKIYSKFHRSLEMQRMGSDYHDVIKNQSIEIIRLFHQSLTHIDD